MRDPYTLSNMSTIHQIRRYYDKSQLHLRGDISIPPITTQAKRHDHDRNSERDTSRLWNCRHQKDLLKVKSMGEYQQLVRVHWLVYIDGEWSVFYAPQVKQSMWNLKL